jgi:predicted TPR repeat methyltransferase
MEISALYDKQFFEMHVPWRAEYVAIANVLARSLSFSSTLDLGCGNGFLLARLKELGKEVCGLDGSVHALEAVPREIRDHIILHDLTTPLSRDKFDLVICTEVAEHLGERFAELLVDTICAHSRTLVYFTAATPGQGGQHHVNEQPAPYWIEKFQMRGFHLLTDVNASIQQDLENIVQTAWWFVRNSMVFAKREKGVCP